MRERIALRRYTLYIYVYKKERVHDRWVMVNHREGVWSRTVDVDGGGVREETGV